MSIIVSEGSHYGVAAEVNEGECSHGDVTTKVNVLPIAVLFRFPERVLVVGTEKARRTLRFSRTFTSSAPKPLALWGEAVCGLLMTQQSFLYSRSWAGQPRTIGGSKKGTPKSRFQMTFGSALLPYAGFSPVEWDKRQGLGSYVGFTPV